MRMKRAWLQKVSGGLSGKRIDPKRGVIQSPESTICRAALACSPSSTRSIKSTLFRPKKHTNNRVSVIRITGTGRRTALGRNASQRTASIHSRLRLALDIFEFREIYLLQKMLDHLPDAEIIASCN